MKNEKISGDVVMLKVIRSNQPTKRSASTGTKKAQKKKTKKTILSDGNLIYSFVWRPIYFLQVFFYQKGK